MMTTQSADDVRQRANLALQLLTSLLQLGTVLAVFLAAPQLFQALQEFREERKAWREHDVLMQAGRQRAISLQMELQAQQEANLQMAREIARTQHQHQQGEK